jgi:hypothetical protein
LYAVQDDLWASLVEFYGPVNLDDLTFEHAHIPDILEIGSEDHDGEGASRSIIAEVNEVVSVVFYLHVQHLAGYTLDLSDVLSGIVDGNAVRSEQRRRRQDEQEQKKRIR